jgi:hypothetical protein
VTAVVCGQRGFPPTLGCILPRAMERSHARRLHQGTDAQQVPHRYNGKKRPFAALPACVAV